MPQRRMIRANDLSGLFIYQDPKRGTVFYDYLTRKGYILTSSDVGMYTLYQMMLPLCLLAALGVVSFIGVSYPTALIVFLVLFILSEILFRIFFFYKLAARGGKVASLQKRKFRDRHGQRLQQHPAVYPAASFAGTDHHHAAVCPNG